MKKDDVTIDLFLKFASVEAKKEIFPKVKDLAAWNVYSSTIVRGFCEKNRAAMEAYLFDELGFTRDQVRVIDGNQELFRI